MQVIRVPFCGAAVPLGAFLSGGVDSSTIAAIAPQHTDALHTFTVGEGSRNLEAARVVARHLDTIHHEFIITADGLFAGYTYYQGIRDSSLLPQELETYRTEHTSSRLRSGEEALYHKVFVEMYRRPQPILENAARWADRPEGMTSESSRQN